MIKKHIYAKENFKIVKIKLEINEKILNKLLCEMREFYKISTDYSQDQNNQKIEKKENIYTILNDILNCKENLKTSHLVCNLLNYKCTSKEENIFLNQSLLCFHFSEEKGLLDFKRILLNLDYKTDLNAADPYYIDENTISEKIEKLPFVKTK